MLIYSRYCQNYLLSADQASDSPVSRSLTRSRLNSINSWLYAKLTLIAKFTHPQFYYILASYEILFTKCPSQTTVLEPLQRKFHQRQLKPASNSQQGNRRKTAALMDRKSTYMLSNSPQYHSHQTEVSFTDSSTCIRVISPNFTASSRVNRREHISIASS